MKVSLLLDHVQITVPTAAEEASRRFYGSILGLPEIEKPENLRKHGGAWYQVGTTQLHLSLEEVPRTQNEQSKRHVCFRSSNLMEVERRLRAAGIAIIADTQPTPEAIRFYVRDPGGNRVEISQRQRLS